MSNSEDSWLDQPATILAKIVYEEVDKETKMKIAQRICHRESMFTSSDFVKILNTLGYQDEAAQ